LYKARDWGFFDLLSDLGLPLISIEQISLSRQPFSIEDNVLVSMDVASIRIKGIDLLLSDKISCAHYSSLSLNLSNVIARL